MTGIFSIYKPKGITSHDVVNRVRRITGEKRVGHAGTLDPLASGVLVIGIGAEATKKLGSEMAKEKEYVAEIKLGEESETDDEEGVKTKIDGAGELALSEIEKALPFFIGRIKQVPPKYSAVKLGGKPAYRLARKGITPVLKEREVEVKAIKIESYQWPMLIIRVTTGPGVYIRSLARDIGRLLKVGGYLRGLERTRVGKYSIENSVNLEQFELQNHK